MDDRDFGVLLFWRPDREANNKNIVFLSIY